GEHARPAERLPDAARANGRETILVVEDDAALRAFAVEALSELGYRVLPAADAQIALDTLDREPDIDLLFTDVVMPGGRNGRQLADEAVKRRPTLKVLFTTGYTRNAIIHHGRLDPGVNLIGKPYTFEELGTRVRTLLDGQTG
ncbi:MAG TPA: response regulator, partial [Reyranella sp.]